MDDEEVEDFVLHDFYINPNSNFCFSIDLLVFSITIIISIGIPYFLANKLYLYDSKHCTLFLTINYLSDIIYLIDIIYIIRII